MRACDPEAQLEVRGATLPGPRNIATLSPDGAQAIAMHASIATGQGRSEDRSVDN